MKRTTWRQISGDMDPGTYGGVIARFDNQAVEIFEIQPVREFVSEEEAREVGFPFWTNEAYYYPEDLDTNYRHVQDALRSCDLRVDDLPANQDDRNLVIAECLLRYGYKAEPGSSGWSEDILTDKVRWATQEYTGASHLADEDEEFRELVFSPVKIRETYEIITPESAEIGDVEERGFIDEEGTDYTYEEAVDLLEGTEPSSSQFHEGIWYTRYEHDENPKTGARENRSYHLDRVNPVAVQEAIYKRVVGESE